jgi:hypothetical protein
MNPYMLKEEFGCGLNHDILLAGCQNVHFRELIVNSQALIVGLWQLEPKVTISNQL